MDKYKYLFLSTTIETAHVWINGCKAIPIELGSGGGYSHQQDFCPY